MLCRNRRKKILVYITVDREFAHTSRDRAFGFARGDPKNSKTIDLFAVTSSDTFDHYHGKTKTERDLDHERRRESLSDRDTR